MAETIKEGSVVNAVGLTASAVIIRNSGKIVDTQRAKRADKVIGMMTPKNGDDEWTHFEGDHFYKRYYFMPSTFNSMSMYRGNRWHSATFDAKNTKRGRYSMVACIL